MKQILKDLVVLRVSVDQCVVIQSFGFEKISTPICIRSVFIAPYMRTRTRLGEGGGGARQLGWASCLVSAGRAGNPVRRDNFFSYKHFGSPTRGEMAQIVSGARHFVQYVTCLAVSRETSVLEGTAVTTHNSK